MTVKDKETVHNERTEIIYICILYIRIFNMKILQQHIAESNSIKGSTTLY